MTDTHTVESVLSDLSSFILQFDNNDFSATSDQRDVLDPLRLFIRHHQPPPRLVLTEEQVAELVDDGPMPEFTPEEEARFRAQEEYYSALNGLLLTGDRTVAEYYLRLRNRTARLRRLVTLQAPDTIVNNEWKLVEQALDLIDPKWKGWGEA